MDAHAISVNTADWLAATRGMKISAYVEAPVSEEESGFTKGDFEQALRKVSRRTKPSQPDAVSSGT